MNDQKQIWQHPWGYIESFLISLGLIVAGIMVEVSAGGMGIHFPAWPGNIFILGGFVLVLFSLHLFLRKSWLVKWLSGIPAAISAVSAYAFLVMIMAIVPQTGQTNYNPSLTAFNHITHSWPYLMTSLYLLTSLGLVTLRRITPFTKQNLGFVLNHAGLWLAIVAGSLGASDIQRLSINLKEGEVAWKLKDTQGVEHDLGFAIKLLDFKLEEYEAKIGILDNQKSELFTNPENQPFYATEGNKGTLLNHHLLIEKYLPSAGKFGDRWVPFLGLGSPPAALVSIFNTETEEKTDAWLTCGNFMYDPEYVKFDSNYSFIMIPPEAKKFQSKVQVVSDARNDTIMIEVNKAHKVNGWKIYQLSYNEKLGRYSDTSVLELVRDPWLPYVYIGVFMMIAGAFYLLFTGKRRQR